MRVPGLHNVYNAMAAAATAFELDLGFDVVQEALAEFSGIQRRFQIKGEVNDILVIDDYAHHPAEIKATLETAKKAWKQTIGARPELSTVISAVLDQCKSEQWMEGYIPHAATWLRGHGWNDKMTLDLPDVINEKPWHETASGIEAKGKEYGLEPSQFNTFPEFRAAVMQKSLKAA